MSAENLKGVENDLGGLMSQRAVVKAATVGGRGVLELVGS